MIHVISLIQAYCVKFRPGDNIGCQTTDKVIEIKNINKISPSSGWVNISFGQSPSDDLGGKIVLDLNRYYETKVKIQACSELFLEFTPGLLHLNALFVGNGITINFTNNKDIFIKSMILFKMPIFNDEQKITVKRISGFQSIIDPIIGNYLKYNPHHVTLFINDPTFISLTDKGVRYITIDDNAIFDDSPFPEFELSITNNNKFVLDVEEKLTRRMEYKIKARSNGLTNIIIPGKFWVDKELRKDFKIVVETKRELTVEHELGVDMCDESLFICNSPVRHIYSSFVGYYGFYQRGTPIKNYHVKACMQNPSDYGFMYLPCENHDYVNIFFNDFNGEQSFDFEHVGRGKTLQIYLASQNDVLHCVFRPNTTYILIRGHFIVSPIDWKISTIIVNFQATFQLAEGMKTNFHVNNLIIESQYNISMEKPMLTADTIRCTEMIFDQASKFVSKPTNFEVEIDNLINEIKVNKFEINVITTKNGLINLRLEMATNLTLITSSSEKTRVIYMRKNDRVVSLLPNILIRGSGTTVVNFDESWKYFATNKVPFINAEENASVIVRTNLNERIPEFYKYENISFEAAKNGSYCTSHNKKFLGCDLDSILINPESFENYTIPIKMDKDNQCRIGIIENVKIESKDVNGGNLTIYSARNYKKGVVEIKWLPKIHPKIMTIIDSTVKISNEEIFGLRTLNLLGNTRLILDYPSLKANSITVSSQAYLSIADYLQQSEHRSITLVTDIRKEISITINPYSISVSETVIPYSIYENLIIKTSSDVVIDNGCADHTVIPHVFDIYISENKTLKFTGRWKYANLYKGPKFTEGKIYLEENASCLDGLYNPLFNASYHTHYLTTILATGDDFGVLEPICNISKNVIFYNNVSSLTQSPAFSFKCRHYLLINTTQSQCPFFTNLFVDDKTVVIKSWNQGYARMNYGCVPKRLLLIDTILTIESETQVNFEWLELRGNSDIICKSKIFATDFVGPLDYEPHIRSAVLSEPNIIIDSLNESVLDTDSCVNQMTIYDDHFELVGNRKFILKYQNYLNIKITRYIRTPTFHITFAGTQKVNTQRMPEIHFMYQKKPQIIFDSTFNDELFNFEYPLKLYWMENDEVEIQMEKPFNLYGVALNIGNLVLKPLRICIDEVHIENGCSRLDIKAPITRTNVQSWHSSYIEIYAEGSNKTIEFGESALTDVNITIHLAEDQLLKIEPNSFVYSLNVVKGVIETNNTVFNSLRLNSTKFAEMSLVEAKSLHVQFEEVDYVMNFIKQMEAMKYYIHSSTITSITVSNISVVLTDDDYSLNLSYPKSESLFICLSDIIHEAVKMTYVGDLLSAFDQPLGIIGGPPGVSLNFDDSWENFDSSKRRIILQGFIDVQLQKQNSINARNAIDARGILVYTGDPSIQKSTKHQKAQKY